MLFLIIFSFLVLWWDNQLYSSMCVNFFLWKVFLRKFFYILVNYFLQRILHQIKFCFNHVYCVFFQKIMFRAGSFFIKSCTLHHAPCRIMIHKSCSMQDFQQKFMFRAGSPFNKSVSGSPSRKLRSVQDLLQEKHLSLKSIFQKIFFLRESPTWREKNLENGVPRRVNL